jgi:hypothetical protein
VTQIERLRDQILTPPTALSVLGTTDVRLADAAEPVSTVLQQVYRLSSGGRAGRPAIALIVTANGRTAEKPLALVVDDDLAALVRALEIG